MILSGNMKTLAMSVVAFVLILAMILWMAGAFERKIAPGIAAMPTPYAGLTLTVAWEPMALFEEVSGTVKSGHSADVAAQIPARVKAIHVKSGELVKPGQLLVTLEDETLRARSAQAHDMLSAVNARLSSAKSHYERTRNLYSKESATLAVLEQAAAEYQNLQSQYAAARQSLNEARHVQDYSQVKATFSARVVDRFVEPGDVVSPGMKLLTIHDPRSLRIDTPIRESVAVDLHIGQILEARIDALDTSVPATIEEIVPAATPGARSVLVKTRIQHRPDMLPGMFARIRIPRGEEKVLLVPQSYIRQVGQLDAVWVLDHDQVNRRFIRPGRTLDDGRVKVISGLSAGEKLVLPEDVLP